MARRSKHQQASRDAKMQHNFKGHEIIHTFVTLCHPIRLPRGILYSVEILDKECFLSLKEVVLVLLVGQEDFINGLRDPREETTQPLLVVLSSDTQLQPN